MLEDYSKDTIKAKIYLSYKTLERTLNFLQEVGELPTITNASIVGKTKFVTFNEETSTWEAKDVRSS